MVKLSKAQQRVLATCIEVGGLHRPTASLWGWYRKHPGGYLSKVAGNATIVVLKDRGYLEAAGNDVVAPTDAGRAALAEGDAK